MSAAQMFGVIVSGRLVQTDGQLVSETQVLFNIPDADNINHMVVFMTGQTAFPDSLGGAVYFSWPSPLGQTWQLLGHISNDKPSAIFKITNLKSSGSGDVRGVGLDSSSEQGKEKGQENSFRTIIGKFEKEENIKFLNVCEIKPKRHEYCCEKLVIDTNSNHPFGEMEPQSHMAQIGISVEPLEQIVQQIPALTYSSSVKMFADFSRKMCESLFNYASLFALTQSQMMPNPMENFVPLSKLQIWHDNFQRRLVQNPYFWKS